MAENVSERELAEKLAAACVEAGLPEPEREYAEREMLVTGDKFDLAWPKQRVAVIIADPLDKRVLTMVRLSGWKYEKFTPWMVANTVHECVEYIKEKVGG